jgi:hypothetical protein
MVMLFVAVLAMVLAKSSDPDADMDVCCLTQAFLDES